MKTKSSAVIGAIRPVGTSPNISGLRTNQASMPKCRSLRNSTNFATAMIRTTAASRRGTQRLAGRSKCRTIPIPRSEKQRAVLGAIGM